MDKKRILFVIEKFSDGGKGLCNIFHTIMETYQQSDYFGEPHYQIFMDELHQQQKNINQILIDFSQTDDFINNVDGIFFAYAGCNYHLNPQFETLAYLKHQFPNKKLIFWWWDTAHQLVQQLLQLVKPFADLQINCDGTVLEDTEVFFTPAIERLYHPDRQFYEITFCGRTKDYQDRIQCCQYLKDNGVELNLCGGHVQENLSTEEYAKKIRQSKINLNFCRATAGWLQCKGRVIEIIASQSMLLESTGPVTPQYFTPYVDYVPFFNEHDLLEKAKYYIEHDEEREKIAKAGYQKYLEKYHYKHLWDRIVDLLDD